MDIAIAELFLDAKEQILNSADYSTSHKVKALFNLLTTILEEVTQSDKIDFTTLYSRAAFMTNRYHLDSQLMYYLHVFRRDNERMKIKGNSGVYLTLGAYVIDELIDSIWNKKEKPLPVDPLVSAFFEQGQKEVIRFKPVVEAVVDSIDLARMEVFFYEETEASTLKKVI